MAPTARKLVSILSLAAFVAVLVLNTLAVRLPLGGMTTGQLSDLYPNLFVPAGLTFSIWGIIYLLLAVFVVYNIRSAWAGNREFVETIGPLFIITCLANCGWILAWQYRVVLLSLVLMIILLTALILIYRRLRIGRSGAPTAEKYLVHLPMSIYLGWISVATIANLTALLVSYHWAGAAGQAWAVVMVSVAILLALLVVFTRNDLFYAIVADWAILGIYLKRSAERSTNDQAVVVAAAVGLAVVSVAIIVQAVRRRVYT